MTIRMDLLDLFGRGYVIEHCMSLFKKRQEEKAYKIYMSDVGFALANFVGKLYGAKENIIGRRFIEILEPPKDEKEEETEEQIIARIRKKLEG